jgi:phenylacetate-CoA ligase
MPRSALNEIVWPALPDSFTATVLAVLAQLERSQWWPPDLLREVQLAQLGHLVAHASSTAPFHRERLAAAGYHEGEPLTPELWARLPVLTRAEVQEAGPALRSAAVPPAHGQVREVSTSGSTGTPVAVAHTGLSQLFFGAIEVRARLWHGLELDKTFCAILNSEDRPGLNPEGGPGEARDAAAPAHAGLSLDYWPDIFGTVFPTGPGGFLPIQADVARQAEWLQEQDPHYLGTFSTNAFALARHCLEHGIRLPRLERVLTGAEPLTAETRAACREAWGAAVVDHYGTREVGGNFAVQCPEREDVLHVQAEGALVEVLDDDGLACGPGEVGRVVVTPLHNFVTPLLRYALGDQAEVGPPCGCGRGLPVLARVLGRTRNMLRLPSGGSVWPSLRAGELRKTVPAVRQFQLVQRSLEGLELRLVVRRPLAVAEEAALRDWLLRRLGHRFAVAISYHDEIPRSARGKYEDFRSELPG